MKKFSQTPVRKYNDYTIPFKLKDKTFLTNREIGTQSIYAD